MTQIRFYRGTLGTSLPAHNEGAIFVLQGEQLEGDIYKGDLYVDVDQGKRLHITENSPIRSGPASNWPGSTLSENGVLYIITPSSSGESPVIKIGDGATTVGQLPAISTSITNDITQLQTDVQDFKTTKKFLECKINAERLILSKEAWGDLSRRVEIEEIVNGEPEKVSYIRQPDEDDQGQKIQQ